MTENSQSAFRAGFVAVMGRPNVGKSTLINSILGQKIAAVSPRPQTTRHQQLGILTREDAQIIFIDTPGLHRPLHKLGEFMNKEAVDALNDCDVILFIVDINQYPPHDEDYLLVNALEKIKDLPPTILALNKIDILKSKHGQDEIEKRSLAYQNLLPNAQSIKISALTGENLEELINLITQNIPINEAFFPEDQITDLFERDIVADLIREAALNNLRDEVPHAIAVRIDEFTERDNNGLFIAATLFVEKESHKGIVIGKGGQMLKTIGTNARKEIEAMNGKKVYLQLRVKVRKNWRNNESILKNFGFRFN